MNLQENITDAQLRYLLGIVDRHREDRCNELLQDARASAHQAIKQAFSEVRSRMHQEVLDLREHRRQQIASAEAHQKTKIRQQRQHIDQELLAALWQPLHEALLRRWQQAEPRRTWIRELIKQAAATLVSKSWTIEHSADWPVQERTALEAQLSQDITDLVVSFSVLESIQAGLRISAGGASVDGTLEGLLRERSLIEASLLAGVYRYRRMETS